MICSRFIHIHVPRTGGSLFRSVVNGCVVKQRVCAMITSRAHMHMDESKALSPNARTVTIIRNPFDWYVSSYHRAIDTGTFGGTFQQYIAQCIECGETMTKIWNDYMDNQTADTILRFESLVADITEFVTSTFPEVSAKSVSNEILRRGKVRASVGRMPFEMYYNEGTVEKIGELDKQLLVTFGYSCAPVDSPAATTIAIPNKGWY